MSLNDPVPSVAADVLERNVQDFDRFVVGSANTFVNRLGVEKLTIAGINGVVLTGNPAVQAAQQAIDAKNQAIDAKNEAQLYAEAAATNADWVYPDVAAGEAVRTDGDYFWVVSANDAEVLELWLMGAVTATDTGKRTVSNERVSDISEMVADTAKKLGETEPDNIAHGFVDADGRLLGYFNDDGEFECYPTASLINRLKSEQVIEENDDDNFVYLLLDAEGRILWSVDKHGNKIPNDSSQPSGSEIPNKTPLPDVTSTVTLTPNIGFHKVIEKLDLQTTALGRTGDPPVEISGDGLTHPKMIYIPQGWNGYKYWLAATPTFGVTPGAAYENPHVWASNDCVTWVEPSGGRIDAPEDGNGSYWSDTHLAIDDDGWMYCFYRGNNFSFSDRCVVAKRSRDGVNWSDRIMIYNANDGVVNSESGLMSPAFFKNGTRWMCVDIVANTTGFPIPPTNYGDGRAVFKRASNSVASDYEEYDQSQIVNYLNREWGAGKEPWHIDAIQVGNLHLHLVNAVDNGLHTGQELYLAWSSDGWNFNVLPRLDTGPTFNIYRSSISVKEVRQDEIDFDVVVARRNGTMDLYKLTLEVN